MHGGRNQLKKSNQTPKKKVDIFGRLGDSTIRAFQSVHRHCTFIFHIFRAMWLIIRGRGGMRRVDLWVELDKAGLRAIPIVCVVSFMIGLIIAFVGHMQLALFGAEIYVAVLVAISMTRIIGAIMTATMLIHVISVSPFLLRG